MKTLFIEPFDTLFFRGGEPMGMGESHDIGTCFPPGTETFYGAIRAFVLHAHCFKIAQYRKGCNECTRHNGCPVPAVVGTRDKMPDTLVVRGPFLGRRANDKVEPLFSPPLDLLVEEESKELRYLNPRQITGSCTDLEPLQVPSVRNVENCEYPEGYLTATGMRAYFEGKGLLRNENDLVKDKELYAIEERTGIGLVDHLRQVEEGRLYATRHYRFKIGVGFVVEVRGLDDLLPDKGNLLLGGEKRLVSFFEVGPVERFVQLSSDQVRLVSPLPSCFRNGHLPDWLDPNTLEGVIPDTDVKVKLVSLATGRYTNVGGFNMVTKMAKPINRWVPAGAVYWCQILSGNTESLRKQDEYFIGGWGNEGNN